MKLIFTRHGESEANVLHEFSNRGLKHGLTATGRREAHRLADRLSSTSVYSLYASPLLRAIQTAAILSETLRIPYEVTDALREYDCGILEGRSDAAGWALYDEVLHDWLANRNWERRIEGGESFLDIQSRFVPFVERLIAGDQGEATTHVLVAHGGLYRCMLPLILDNIDFGFALAHGLGNAESIVAETVDSALTCRAWGPIHFG